MRILYITNGFPFPLTSGYLRHYFLIKELSQHHEISLLSLVRPSFRLEHAEAMAPITERVMAFAPSSAAPRFGQKTLRRMRFVTGGDPAVRRLCRAVRRLLREESFDVVVLSGKQTFPVLRQLGDLPVVVDLCDATSARIRGTIPHAGLRRLPRLIFSYLHLRRIEKRLIHHASHVLFASSRDREALIDGSGHQASVVPNGVDLDYWRRSSRVRGEKTIVFTGGMSYPPNVDAALFLIEDVFPVVQRSIPDARLLIVGCEPTAELIEAGRRPGVTVTGFVEDMRPYLEQATVFAAPLRFGAGIQNKVLEAMAMEVPVVASPVAANGLRTVDGDLPPIHVARQRQQFAEILIRLLSDRTGNPAPVADTRQFVRHHFVWARSADKFNDIIHSVANKPSCP